MPNNISSPIKTAKSRLKAYWKILDNPKFKELNSEVKNVINNNEEYYNDLKNNSFDDIENRIAWEYLRRDHMYQFCYSLCKETLELLKNEIKKNPEEYYKNEELIKLCKSNFKNLSRLSLFGFSNPLHAQCPTSNEPPIFCFREFFNKDFNIKHEIEDYDNKPKRKSNTPKLYTALCKMGIISKKIRNELNFYRYNYPYIEYFSISLMHDINKQIQDIKNYVKEKKIEYNLNKNRVRIDIKEHIIYINLIDKLHNIDSTKIWTDEIEVLKLDTKDQTFNDRVGHAIYFTHKRGYLDIVKLPYMKEFNHRNNIKNINKKWRKSSE